MVLCFCNFLACRALFSFSFLPFIHRSSLFLLTSSHPPPFVFVLISFFLGFVFLNFSFPFLVFFLSRLPSLLPFFLPSGTPPYLPPYLKRFPFLFTVLSFFLPTLRPLSFLPSLAFCLRPSSPSPPLSLFFFLPFFSFSPLLFSIPILFFSFYLIDFCFRLW